MTKRLTLEMSDQAYAVLEQLATDLDKNKAEILRQGLALRKFAHDASEKQLELAVIDPKDESIQRRLLLAS